MPQRTGPGLMLSGPSWVDKFPNSRSINDLRPPFKASVEAFLAALRRADVHVNVSSTLRPPQRAYLMHFAQAIADGHVAAANVPPRPGVNIQWVHATNAESVEAARQMVARYQIAGPVALDSRHIDGHAIDMDITWQNAPEVMTASGEHVALNGPVNANNPHLVGVGASYGVIRGINIPHDPEHWSIDGH